MMTRYVSRCLESWGPVSDRIITARFYSKCIKTTIVQVYAPPNYVEDKATRTKRLDLNLTTLGLEKVFKTFSRPFEDKSNVLRI